jgi:hypothetical protein
MKKALVLVTALAMLSVGLVLAHGDKNRVMGNVTKVNGQNLDVKTADGHVVSVRLDKATKYMKGKEKATLQDVKVGSRVVVHLMAHDGPPMASEVLLPGAGQEHGDHGHEQEKAVPGRG